ncbi:hypothetical protein RRG08_037452 [Elysia crispata]|uniref:Uncharacterized protein n=1 Tax=Elysia crispata TaxID=231223 RepID=A0AAE0Y4B4_9GAST|nr:hypothetical protein RRG08_037452 [Elysia crispata]
MEKKVPSQALALYLWTTSFEIRNVEVNPLPSQTTTVKNKDTAAKARQRALGTGPYPIVELAGLVTCIVWVLIYWVLLSPVRSGTKQGLAANGLRRLN